jgi:hypothetical protein
LACFLLGSHGGRSPRWGFSIIRGGSGRVQHRSKKNENACGAIKSAVAIWK